MRKTLLTVKAVMEVKCHDTVSEEEDLTYSGGCDEGEMPRYRFRGGQTHSENRLSQTPDAQHALRLQPVSFLLLKIINANDRKVKVCDVSDLET